MAERWCKCIMDAHCKHKSGPKRDGRCRLMAFGTSGEGSPGVAGPPSEPRVYPATDVHPLVEVARNALAELERALIEASQQRDQLLEAIDAHRKEKSHGRTANMQLFDERLYELADQIKGSTQLDAQPMVSTKEPETCEDPRLQELLEWVDAEEAKRHGWLRIVPRPKNASALEGGAYAFQAVAERIHQLQANEEKGGEG